MALAVRTALIPEVAPLLEEAVRRWAPALPDLHYADARLEVVESKFAVAENGTPRISGDEQTVTLGVRVLAGRRAVAAGYHGRTLGARDLPSLASLLREALAAAHRRARASAEHKADARDKLGPLGETLADTHLCPVGAARDTVPAVFERDPRDVTLDEAVRLAVDVARQARATGSRVAHARVAVTTALARELFASSEGALVDQSFAFTQGLCAVVATGADTAQELWDVLGHQRGWEILERGVEDPLLRFPPFALFATDLAREALALAEAPPLPAAAGEVTVVTDPHYNALLAHEIIGHPAELDRALKMETAYAGRSWLLRDRERHHLGRQIASPLVSAFSDPALPGYGHYRYDHEGTPGRRVVHIDRGVFAGFMNSRQTAAVFGGVPNGHSKATEAALVPLIRMSTTVFAGGERDPADIVAEVEHGYYLVGHRVPSIAESRENFHISARRVYEIEHGRLGRLYRDGGITADSRDFLTAVDAVGRDFRLYPIPNCGKGQPMQVKRLGNGGPTLRSRARLGAGRS